MSLKPRVNISMLDEYRQFQNKSLSISDDYSLKKHPSKISFDADHHKKHE
jgi:hypothetical protein